MPVPCSLWQGFPFQRAQTDQPFAGAMAGPTTEEAMIIDGRTYASHPGKVKASLEDHERLGKPIQWPIIGEPRSMADREQCRLRLPSAPGGGAYLDASMPLLCVLENRILAPTSVSPLKRAMLRQRR
jgi:hypothetical protein